MIIKPYEPSGRLQLLKFVMARQEKSADQLQRYLNLEKGHEGEQKFAEMLETVSSGWLILHDLLLEHSGSMFQIDALLISEKKIYLFEVKNFEGDYYVEADKWYTTAGIEIKSPVLQLVRSESMFRQLLQELRLTIPIEARLIFINHEFSLFQAPLDFPLILPTQLNRLMDQLKMQQREPGRKAHMLAEKLISSHITESPYNRLPPYHFSDLRKGIPCNACNSFSTLMISRRSIGCAQCGQIEIAAEAIIRNITQYQLLFPNAQITTALIHDWCQIIPSKKSIRRVLNENLTAVGTLRHTHYIAKNPVE